MERGLVTSSWGKSVLTSKVYSGLTTKSSDQNQPDKHITIPLFPHGLKSLHPGVKELCFVHTHFKPKELDHLSTTLLTDDDIESFARSVLKTLIMIDQGGIHMLIRQHQNTYELPKATALNALHTTRQNANSVHEVMELTAKELLNYHIGYYFNSWGKQTDKDSVKLDLITPGFAKK